MNHQGLLKPGHRPASTFASGIELLLLEFALGGSIVGGAPLRGAFLVVGVTASKGTIDIPSARITEIGQKDNAAVPASLQAWLEAGMLSYNATKSAHIATGDPANSLFPIPSRFEPKKRLKLHDKKAKSSLVWLIRLDIPSFSFMFFADS